MPEKRTRRRWPKVLGIIIFILIIIPVGLIAYLTLTEYHPADITTFEVEVNKSDVLATDKTYTAIAMNIGYGALGEEADFFMDGGSHVLAGSEEEVYKNLEGIQGILTENAADFTLLQEVDVDSKRSFFIDERTYLQDKAFDGQATYFAPNYKTNYVPFPWPPMGKVESGLLTHSLYAPNKAERVSLSVPFTWPVRLANLKRCLLVTHHSIKGSDKELVLINLHLEAYDDTGGREKQTQELLTLMQQEYAKGNYVVAGGDFNQSFFPPDKLPFPIREDLWQPGQLDDHVLPEGFYFYTDTAKIPTSRLLNEPYNPQSENTVYYIIDGFLVSPNVKVKSVKTLDEEFRYSDHNPVVLEFKLSPKE